MYIKQSLREYEGASIVEELSEDWQHFFKELGEGAAATNQRRESKSKPLLSALSSSL
jgi:hypothetical protein